MIKDTQKEYDVAIQFYENIISKFNADFPYYTALLKVLQPKSVLELGCGSGRLFPLYLKEGIAKIVGIDLSHEMVKQAEKKYPSVQVYQGDIANYVLDEKFDLVVISNSLLKHIEAPETRLKVLNNAKKFLSENGVISIDHSSFLYYEEKTSDWKNASESVVSDWIPNDDNRLDGFQWRKEVVDNKDIALWRHIKDNVIDFDISFSTYAYKIDDLILDIKQVSLHYLQILTDYSSLGLSNAGNRFIALLAKNEKQLEKQVLDIRKEFLEKCN